MTRTLRSRARCALRRGMPLVPLLCLGACAPTHNPPPPSASPLTIDFQWRPPGTATSPIPHPLRNQAPDSFVIRWDPAEIAAADVRYVAEQQCLAWNRQPRAVGEASARGGARAQRFVCDAPLIKH